MSEIVYLENKKSNNKTLILDLDETLIHTWRDPSFINTYEIYTNPERYKLFYPQGKHPLCYLIKIDNDILWGLCRPYLYEFLNFVYSEFENVIIWSAGIKQYVVEVVRQIFIEVGLPMPKFIWSRKNCHLYQNYYHKPISELITYISNKPYKMSINYKNTLIIDDKPSTFLANPNNGILIPEFIVNDNPIKLDDLLNLNDNCLKKLIDWFNTDEFRNCKDVQLLDKSKIFI